METFTLYNLPELPKPELFVPPPYCRKVESSEDGKGSSLSLKLTVSNPAKLLILYETLTDKSSKALEAKLNIYLTKESKSKSTFLLHFSCTSKEAFVQTLGLRELESTLRFPISKDIIAHLIQYQDDMFKCDIATNQQIAEIFREMFNNLNYRITAVPIVQKGNIYPCCTKEITPVLLTCFIDSENNEDYLIKLSNELFKYCLPILMNTMAYEEELKQKRQYQSLFTLMPKVFGTLDNTNLLLQTLSDETRKLTTSKYCGLFLTDSDLIELISKVLSSCAINNKIKAKLQVAKDHAIPNYVATTGQVLNYEKKCEFLNNKELTECTGFETKNILCFPIRVENEVIGAVQVCNKYSGRFVSTDEEFANYLSLLFGIALSHSLKYSKLQCFQARDKIANELMIYEIKVIEEDVKRILFCPYIHFANDFEKFCFLPRSILKMESVCYVLKMFEDLGFFSTFSINKELLTRFIVHVKEGCRDVPYHNWMHLFSTAHTAYLFLTHLELRENKYITELEALAFFIACLCHDIEYRGANNPFQKDINNGLISLYSSSGSVAARYRLSQVLRILNIQGCNFLEYFDRSTYTLFLNLLKGFILAADLTTHFKFFNKQCDMIRSGYNKKVPEHRYVFTTLLVAAADLSDFIKEWTYVKQAAILLFEEFFTVGDLERKERVKFQNLDLVNLPDLQIDFLKEVCLPIYKMLSMMFPILRESAEKIKRHIFYWECSKHLFQKAFVDGISSFDLLASEEFDRDVEAAVVLVESSISESQNSSASVATDLEE